MPWARMKRVTFARSTYSGEGVQTTSSIDGPPYPLPEVSSAVPRYNGRDGAARGGRGGRLVRVRPDHRGRLLQGADVRGRPASPTRTPASNPRSDIDSFVCASEDFEEGTSIFDEYVPDQLGAVQRPVQTVVERRAVRARHRRDADPQRRSRAASRSRRTRRHRRSSRTAGSTRMALDPVLNRPLGMPARRRGGAGDAAVPPRERLDRGRLRGGRRPQPGARPRATPARRTPTSWTRRPTFEPLTADQTARSADGCVVLVLAAEDVAGDGAVWVDGVGWNQDAPSLESRDWDRAARRDARRRERLRPSGHGAGGRRPRRGRRHVRVQAAAAPGRARAPGAGSRPA